MSDIQVTSVDGSQINVSTGTVVGPLPSLQLAAGSGIDISNAGGVSTISANLSAPENLADLSDVSSGATSGQVLSYNGTSWGGLTLSVPQNIADLSDVSGVPTTGQALLWTGTEWAPSTVSSDATLNGLFDLSEPAQIGDVLTWDGVAWVPGEESAAIAET
ncbi:MAG: hypothetical protein ACO3O3_11075, partial [Ilumatobacteraceae bacterium]